MHIPDEQLDLLASRLSAIGVGRRDFLTVVGAMAAFGGLGFATTAQAAKPSKPGPGEKLAKDQTFRMGGGGWNANAVIGERRNEARAELEDAVVHGPDEGHGDKHRVGDKDLATAGLHGVKLRVEARGLRLERRLSTRGSGC